MNTNIRLSTASDLQVIHSWLVKQSKLELEDNFLCNWDLTEKTHREENLYVCTDMDNSPIAYLWGNFGILDVKYELRCNGIGRRLVEFGLHNLSKKCVAVSIECAPATSSFFWEKMGFHYYNRDGNSHKVFMYKKLQRKNELFLSGTKSVVTVKVFPKRKGWDDKTKEVETIKCEGVYFEGCVYLERRLIVFGGLVQQPVLEVCVDGKVLKRARATACRDIGVERCKGDFYSDIIRVDNHV